MLKILLLLFIYGKTEANELTLLKNIEKALHMQKNKVLNTEILKKVSDVTENETNPLMLIRKS